LVLSVAVIATSALIFLLAGWIIDRRVQGLLDDRLGEALIAQARTIAAELEMPDEDSPVALALTLGALARARLASGAEMVVLLDARGNVVAADPPTLGARPYLRLDNAPLAAALTGRAAYGERYRLGGIDLKSAFAPVSDPFGEVVGAVGVEAPAGFFGALREVRLALAATLGIGMVLVVGLTLVVWRFWSRSEASERALWRSQHLAMIGQMTATMAHEVRNPLSIIKATAERIRRKYGDGSELFEFIPEEADRLDRLTRWYLNFARPTDLTFAPVTLAEIAEESLSRLRKELEAADIAVNCPTGDAKGECEADRDRLVQAVLNVLINAQQAIGRGGTITVHISEHGERVRLEIKDTGRGIPLEEQPLVFEPFRTTKTTGSGLGLAVVRQVIEAHGGSVGLESTPGVGTKVWLELPRRVSDAR